MRVWVCVCLCDVIVVCIAFVRALGCKIFSRQGAVEISIIIIIIIIEVSIKQPFITVFNFLLPTFSKIMLNYHRDDDIDYLHLKMTLSPKHNQNHF